ncbi:TetR/AcrR family transcriptional regulator [Nocardia sp. CA2R105]|uniref:TetR/AcrR family transcriptional regulator n=1 Tax=Nocardia coffeae TaxID=2873381 RepID=UPI001CA71813|nr:TetR/AcrR family transcriptional regulator [Nocardia coffeae]MBY8859189.1 TetR/AcrR family transcriptional regulator [Nocardia coffeae]
MKATIHRLVEDGYRGMSLARIAADAGTTRPTVYLRWETKQALVVDAVRRTLERKLPEMPRAWHDLPAKERLVRVLELLHQRDEPERGLLYATILAESHRLPELRELLREYLLEPPVREITDLLETMRARGEVRADLDCALAAKMLYGVQLVDHFETAGTSLEIDRDSVDFLWPLIARPPGDNTTP